MLKFKEEVTQEKKDEVVREHKALKNSPFVKGGRAILGGPSVTDDIKFSKGFDIAFVSYHEDLEGLRQYRSTDKYNEYD